jgi:hypothetical protein
VGCAKNAARGSEAWYFTQGEAGVSIRHLRPLQGGLADLIEAMIKGQPTKPRAVTEPPPVIDLMAALKRSLAREAPARVSKTNKEKRTRAVSDRRQPLFAYRCPGVEGGRSSPPRSKPPPLQRQPQEGISAAKRQESHFAPRRSCPIPSIQSYPYSYLIAIRINPKYRSFNYKFYSAFYSRRITN